MTAQQLKAVASGVQAKLRLMSENEIQNLLTMTDYHGFAKALLPESLFSEIIEPLGIASDDIQIEIVYVGRDLSKEIHVHRKATAIAICLGPDEHLPVPIAAEAFLVDHWFPIQAGDIIEIPAGTPHGFTTKGEGFYFLSVQSPPIVSKEHSDDYFEISTEPPRQSN